MTDRTDTAMRKAARLHARAARLRRPQRRQELLQRSAVLRTRIATGATALAPAFDAADVVQDAGRTLRQHWLKVALTATTIFLVAARRPAAVARVGRGVIALLPALPYLYSLLRRR